MAHLFKIAVLLVLLSFTIKSQASAKMPFLSKLEAAKAGEFLSEICGETFCRQDFNFSNIGVQCDKYCEIKYDISPHIPNFLTLAMFQQAQHAQRNGYVLNVYWALESAKNFMDYYYTNVGSLVEFENVKVKAVCHVFKLSDRKIGLEQKFQLLYEQQLNCTDAMIINLSRMRNSSQRIKY
jgi:hypothetical protein